MDNDFFASGFQALNSDSLEEIDIEAGFLAVDGHVPVAHADNAVGAT